MNEKEKTISGADRDSFSPGDVIAMNTGEQNLPEGWRPGDPIPVDLARRMSAAAADAARKYPDAEPVRMNQPPVSFDAVKAVKQKELLETLQNIRQSIESAVDAARQTNQVQTASVENQILMRWPEGFSVESSVYNVSDEEAKRQAQSVNAVPAPGSSDFVAFATENLGPESHPKTEEKVEDTPGAGSEPESPSSEENVSRGDLLAYIQAKLSLQRFSKSYSFLGGKFQIKFRTLKTVEAEACREQVRMEGRWSEDTQVTVSRILPYRMAWSVDTMVLNDRTAQVADFLDASFRQYILPRTEVKPEETSTAKRYRILTQQTYLADEQLWNIAYSAYQQFEYLIALMDQMVVKEGFFRKTEG